MFLGTKDLMLLNDVNFYLSELDEEKAQELSKDLGTLIEKLEIKRIARNVVNTKRIMEKRKINKNYARPKREYVED